MSIALLLEQLERLFIQAQISFMVAGSFASSVHGQPRTTNDLDIVIEADRKKIAAFIRALPKDRWYADAGAADDAVLRGSMFNVIDMTTGWKIDLVIRKGRPFSIEEFGRREMSDALGYPVPIATAEDTIIAKLEWSKASNGSERQRRDVRAIVDMKRETLDRAYLAKWIAALALEAEWDAVNAE